MSNPDAPQPPDGGGATGDSTPPPQGAGQPAGQPPPQTQANDLIPRTEAQQAFAARDAAKREAQAERERAQAEAQRAAALEAELAKLKAGTPETKPKGGDEPPAWAVALEQKVQAIADAKAAEAQAQKVGMLVQSITAQVPNRDLHDLVAPLFNQLVSAGKVSADADQATALLALKTNHPKLFLAAPGSPRSGVQIGPDGKVANWDAVRSVRDLTDEQIAAMPDEKVTQIISGNTAGGRGLLIAGTPRPLPQG